MLFLNDPTRHFQYNPAPISKSIGIDSSKHRSARETSLRENYFLYFLFYLFFVALTLRKSLFEEVALSSTIPNIVIISSNSFRIDLIRSCVTLCALVLFCPMPVMGRSPLLQAKLSLFVKFVIIIFVFDPGSSNAR